MYFKNENFLSKELCITKLLFKKNQLNLLWFTKMSKLIHKKIQIPLANDQRSGRIYLKYSSEEN